MRTLTIIVFVTIGDPNLQVFQLIITYLSTVIPLNITVRIMQIVKEQYLFTCDSIKLQHANLTKQNSNRTI